jgi:hypothetical protein
MASMIPLVWTSAYTASTAAVLVNEFILVYTPNSSNIHSR